MKKKEEEHLEYKAGDSVVCVINSRATLTVGKEYKIFPMVFDNNKFIGGYTETVKYIDQILDFDISF